MAAVVGEILAAGLGSELMKQREGRVLPTCFNHFSYSGLKTPVLRITFPSTRSHPCPHMYAFRPNA